MALFECIGQRKY
ncbi:hypothetical protein Avbf_07324 [Armadillidium vulgare]|nr:hypothetical protein Avbf_07324 [Armadillidium vulgare]